MEHTPGPWKWENEYAPTSLLAGKKEVLLVDDDGSCGDPDCCGSPSFHIGIKNEADSKLIAAAPELYEACQYIQNYAEKLNAKEEDGPVVISRNAFSLVQKALARLV